MKSVSNTSKGIFFIICSAFFFALMAVFVRLAGDIYFSPGFLEFFEENAAEPDEIGLYPTVTARKIMWKLRMKPLKKEYWEEEL